MKVIVAGFSQTGTMSVKVALLKLGYHPYHMFEALANFDKGHLDMWNDLLEGERAMDWHCLFEGYDASTDLPACIYWREIAQAFPDAQVILTVRDSESWWKSWISLVDSQEAGVDRLRFLPRFKALDRLVINIERVFFGIEPGQYDKEDGIRRFNEHNQAVSKEIPADRLLVLDVKEGWEPLCEFLGKPIPDEPFPYESVGTRQVEKLMGQIVLRDLFRFALPALSVGLIILIVALVLVLS